MLGEGVEQLCVFVVFCALGVGLSTLYIFGVGLTKSKLSSIIFDSIFGAGCIYVIWKVNLELNNGECRAFLFVGLALGSTITFITCKRTLDKLSAMLYNLFTKQQKTVNNDTHILQKMDIGSIRSGDTGSSVASLHAIGDADSTVVTKQSRKNVGRFNRTSKKRGRRSEKKTQGNGLGRLRNKMGRRA